MTATSVSYRLPATPAVFRLHWLGAAIAIFALAALWLYGLSAIQAVLVMLAILSPYPIVGVLAGGRVRAAAAPNSTPREGSPPDHLEPGARPSTRIARALLALMTGAGLVVLYGSLFAALGAIWANA